MLLRNCSLYKHLKSIWCDITLIKKKHTYKYIWILISLYPLGIGSCLSVKILNKYSLFATAHPSSLTPDFLVNPSFRYGGISSIFHIIYFLLNINFINFQVLLSMFIMFFLFAFIIACVNLYLCLFLRFIRCFVNFWFVIYLVINGRSIPHLCSFTGLMSNRAPGNHK